MQTELLRRAIEAHRNGRTREAETLYELILAANPDGSDACHLLGVLKLQNGDAASAVELIERATRLQPRNWVFLANLAQAFFTLRRFVEAGDAFQSAARLNSDDPELQIGMANCLALQGELAEAETRLRKITERFPRVALAWFNLGNAVRDQGKTKEAVACYARATQLDTNFVDAFNNLGNALHALERLEEAEQAYRKALALQPSYTAGHCNLASLLIDRGRFPEAEAACREALSLEPHSAIAYSMLGSAIGHQGRLSEALEMHRKAVELDPNSPRTLAALGGALYEVGRAEEAQAPLERALSADPQSAYAHHFLASARLGLGDFQAWWRGYLQRPARQRFIAENPALSLTTALPAALTGQHVCLLREQGLGDELFLLRFAAALKARGAHLTYRASARIAGLLGRVAMLDRVMIEGEPLPESEHVVLIGDLPHALHESPAMSLKAQDARRDIRPDATGAFIPALARASESGSAELPPPLPLTPLAAQIETIQRRLAELGPPPYIGLTWRGGTAPEEQRGSFWLLFKEVPLQQLGEVLAPVNGTLLALQRRPRDGELARIAACVGRTAHDFTALNEDLEGMLALLAAIDDYVGVSNTNMHLRAGVGKTARVLVPCPSEWRWMVRGCESPWFPGFRIYRQEVDGDWSGALTQLKCDLAARFGSR